MCLLNTNAFDASDSIVKLYFNAVKYDYIFELILSYSMLNVVRNV